MQIHIYNFEFQPYNLQVYTVDSGSHIYENVLQNPCCWSSPGRYQSV